MTAREWEIALPAELDGAARLALAEGFAAELVKRYGVAADIALHAPHREGDQRNFHAHILTTTRRMGPEGLGEKTRVLDSPKTSGAEIAEMRALWALMQNRALEAAGSGERVDHRSLEAQRLGREMQAEAAREGEEERLALALEAAAAGLDRPAEPRLGVAGNAVERKARRKAEAKGEAYESVTKTGAVVAQIREIRADLRAMEARAAEAAEMWFEVEDRRAAEAPMEDAGDWGAGAMETMEPEGRDLAREASFEPEAFPQGEGGQSAEAEPSPRGKRRGPSWTDYLGARANHRAELTERRKAEEERRSDERSALRRTQKAERDAIWVQDWAGRGDVLEALRSVTAAHQAAALAELWERHSAERKAEREAMALWPDYAAWRAGLGAPAPALVLRGEGEERAQAQDIRGFGAEAEGRHVHYRRKEGEALAEEIAFTDKGRQIDIHAEDEAATLAALQLGAQKWGVVHVEGDEAYKALCVRLSARHGVKIGNAELQDAVKDERERLRLVEEQDKAARAAASARQTLEAWTAKAPKIQDPEERRKAEAMLPRLEAEAIKREDMADPEGAERRRKEREAAKAEAEAQAKRREELRTQVLEKALIEAPLEAQRKDAFARHKAYVDAEMSAPGFWSRLKGQGRAHEAKMKALEEVYDASRNAFLRLEAEALRLIKEGKAQKTQEQSNKRREVLAQEGWARTDSMLRACVSEAALDALMEGRAPSGPVVDMAQAEARYGALEQERALKPDPKRNALESASAYAELQEAYRRNAPKAQNEAERGALQGVGGAATRFMEEEYRRLGLPKEAAGHLKSLAASPESARRDSGGLQYLHSLEIRERMRGGNVPRDQAKQDIEAMHERIQSRFHDAAQEMGRAVETEKQKRQNYKREI